MVDYFRSTPDPERGYALAALTGSLSFQHAKPNLVRALAVARVDEYLFGLSYDYVGDLSEAVALLWPAPPRPRRGGRQRLAPHVVRGGGHARHRRQARPAPPHRRLARRAGRERALGAAQAHHRLAPRRRLRPPRQDGGGRTRRHRRQRGGRGLARPARALHRPLRLGGGPRRQARRHRPRAVPPGHARPPLGGSRRRRARPHRLHRRVEVGRDPRAGHARRRGGRVERGAALLAHRRGRVRDVSRPRARRWPAFLTRASRSTASCSWCATRLVQPFGVLQQRLNRRTVSLKVIADYPAHIRAYDLLQLDGEDLQAASFRRAARQARRLRRGGRQRPARPFAARAPSPIGRASPPPARTRATRARGRTPRRSKA